MTAPEGIPPGPVTGGGDCRMLSRATMDFRSAEVSGGVISLFELSFPCFTGPKADGVLRCRVRYDEDRGKVTLRAGSVCLRSAFGEPGGEAADLEGGVYGIPKAGRLSCEVGRCCGEPRIREEVKNDRVVFSG